MADLVFEIGTEEIPAGFMPPVLRQLADLARGELAAERLEFGAVETFGTPRRMGLLVRDLSVAQPDAVEQKVGPSVQAAFDAEGNPTRAAQGFARSQGLEVEQLLRVETEKGTYVAARKEVRGRPAKAVLAEKLPQWIDKLHFPKKMRWGTGEVAFARPIHWLLAVLGDAVVEFDYAGVTSGRTSRGHRFHHPGTFAVDTAAGYRDAAARAGLMVDPETRRAAIVAGVAEAASAVGGRALLDEGLVETVTHLVEYPYPVAGTFETKYLELPRELLILTMKTHQKYFAVVDAAGELLNHFVTVSNTGARDMAVVARGNERVLRARLADAEFFFVEDRKKSLEEHAEGLKKVVFQSKLGTSHEKVERFRALAAHLAGQLCPGREAAVDRIAQLAKADLETQMVYEFPELQGVVGREYARRAGEDPLVARGIQEHYWPLQAGGELPSAVEIDCVSLADKLDTLAGCFGVGLIPTGTADPYALRRQTLGILRILGEKQYRLSLTAVVATAVAGVGPKLTREPGEVQGDILAFFRGRFEGLLTQHGLAADLVLAALDAGSDDVVDAWARCRALQDAREAGVLAPLTESFKRVANILKGKAAGEVDPARFCEPAERSLWTAYQELRDSMRGAVQRGAYREFLDQAARLKAAVDEFFEAVLVMADDAAVRDNRLALLAAISGLFREVADFTRIA